jgi:2-polyprenyl-6-methoxyphenol hydroxylase-like FAD-dependent oxidoreductase
MPAEPARPRALVVGAGIGGLTAALGLHAADVDVTVLERSTSLEPAGAGLTLQPNALLALDVLGLAGQVIPLGQQLVTAEVRDQRGRTLLGLSPEAGNTLLAEVGAPVLGIHRATLQDVLVREVGHDRIRLATEVVGYTDEGSTVVLADGTELNADIVIGADGLNSRLRAQLLDDGPPRYAGYFCWRGVGPLGTFRHDWGGEYWGPGRRFGGCGIDGDRLYWFVVANGPAGGADSDGAYRAALAAVADFPPEVREAVAATAPESVFRTDIADRDPAESWGEGHLTLLGDAAHPMTPNLGQGACQAIEDAAVLAGSVWRTGACPAALREYERRRRGRADSTVLAARRLGEIAQWSRPAAVVARDAIARAAPASLLRRQLRQAWTGEHPRRRGWWRGH